MLQVTTLRQRLFVVSFKVTGTLIDVRYNDISSKENDDDHDVADVW